MAVVPKWYGGFSVMWGDSETDRLLRQWIALHLTLTAGCLLLAAYFWLGKEDLTEAPTAEAADEWVRARQVAW